QLDWLRIERDWREGNETVRALAVKHGISHGRISQVAKAEGWGSRGASKSASVRRVTNQAKHPNQANQAPANQGNQARQNGQASAGRKPAPKDVGGRELAVVRTWRKNYKHIARVRLTEAYGHPSVDIRSWYRDVVSGELRPAAGFTITLDGIGELV